MDAMLITETLDVTVP